MDQNAEPKNDTDDPHRSTHVQLAATRELADVMIFDDNAFDDERPTAEERGQYGYISISSPMFRLVTVDLLDMALPDAGEGEGEDDAMGTARFRSPIQHARRLREDDRERLTLRDIALRLMERELGGGDYYAGTEDWALQDAISRSMEEYECPTRPADPEVVKALPTVKATPEMTAACPICMDEFLADDDVVSATACVHYMHAACAGNWLAHGDFCAVCRSPVGEGIPQPPSQHS